MPLDDYGWTPFFARHFESFLDSTPAPAAGDPSRPEPARVLSPGRGLYRLATAAGEVTATLPGRLEAAGEVPAVGDWVVVDGAAGGRASILAILPRRTTLRRKVAGARAEAQVLAANVDLVFLVLGLDGDFNPRRLERLAVLARDGGADAVVLLTKADLLDGAPADRNAGLERRIAETRAAAPGLPVHPVSAVTSGGLEALESYLEPGRTVALLGSSGVGKSTLVNRLTGREVLRTAPVRARDERGTHTTTHRELVRLPGGSLLVDGPGLREVQLWLDDPGSLGAAFADVEAVARRCRFRDCTHRHEPGCAVLEALAAGELDEARVKSLRKLEREVAALERRRDPWEARRHERRQGAEYKRIQREKDERGRR